MTLQDVVDELAGALGRPIAIEDPRARVPPEGPRRAELLSDLLAPDEGRRRAAFAEAVERHWLRRDQRTVVRAVLLEGAGGALRRASLARRLDASPSPGLALLGDERGMLLFVGTEEPGAGPADEADAVIRAEAHRHGARVLAIGSARHRREDDDLRPTADHASLAASIVSSLPDGRDRGDIADLGAWVLLSSVAADSSQLAVLSPAAATLLEKGDDVQRQTVETYLDVRGSVREACAILHIHRTTLYYRLDNLPPTVRAALDDGLARSALHLCLKLMRFRGGHERRRAS